MDQSAYLVWPEQHGDAFDSHKFNAIKHNYHHHPLFSLSSLESLAEYLLPLQKCRFAKEALQLDSAFYHEGKSPDNQSIAQVFAQMDQPGSWLALYDVQHHPAYAELLEGIVQSLSPLFSAQQGKLYEVAGFVFLSSAPAFTPFHIDRENNFWLQLHGQKKLSVFDHQDRSVVSQQAVEDFIVYRSLDDVKLDGSNRAKAVSFDVAPGQGVYFPSTTPHMTETNDSWVTQDNGISVSIGVVFYTDWTQHIARLCQYNCIARKLRLPLSDLQGVGVADLLRARAGQALAYTRQRFRSYDAPNRSF